VIAIILKAVVVTASETTARVRGVVM